jgi:hypothetical protein
MSSRHRYAYLLWLSVAACSASSIAPDGGATDADGGSVDAGLEPWLLTIGNASDGNGHMTHALAKLSIAPGELGTISSIVCPDITFGEPDVPNDVVSGLTFVDDVLYATGPSEGGAASQPAAAIYRVNPCSCTATRLGPLGNGLGLVGSITAFGARGLFGMSSTNDAFFTVNTDTGAGTIVRTLPFEVGASGITWSGAQRDSLWFVTAPTDQLYELDETGDQVSSPVPLDYDFDGLGMEYHPGAGRLFACSHSQILEIDPATGHVTVGQTLPWDGGCANLAAPFGHVDCIL